MFAPKVAKPQTKETANSTNFLARQRSAFVAHPLGHDAVEQAQMLQRSIGNQAMLRLMALRTSSPTWNQPGGDHEQEAGRETRTAPGVSWDFSKIPIFPPDRTSQPRESSPQPGVVQRKLAVGQVNDPLEHEADRVADRVMRMSEPQAEPTPTRAGEGLAVPPLVHGVLNSPGQPLDPATRTFMEPRFGHDFSQVRVHTDARAAESARAIGAAAYTAGRNVVFGVGHYEPGAEQGRRLLAHELAHVVQQNQGAVVRRQQLPDVKLGSWEQAPPSVEKKFVPFNQEPTFKREAELAKREALLEQGRWPLAEHIAELTYPEIRWRESIKKSQGEVASFIYPLVKIDFAGGRLVINFTPPMSSETKDSEIFQEIFEVGRTAASDYIDKALELGGALSIIDFCLTPLKIGAEPKYDFETDTPSYILSEVSRILSSKGMLEAIAFDPTKYFKSSTPAASTAVALPPH